MCCDGVCPETDSAPHCHGALLPFVPHADVVGVSDFGDWAARSFHPPGNKEIFPISQRCPDIPAQVIGYLYLLI